MALLRIYPGRTAKCGPGDFVVDYAVEGAPAGSVLVKVEHEGAHGQPAEGVNWTGPSQLVVAAPSGAVAVTAYPASGPFFANGVAIGLQVTLKVDGQHVSTYGLPVTDISGTSSTTLLIIRPQSDYNELVVPLSGPGRAPEDGTLMKDAIYAARRRSGVAKLATDQQSRMFIAVDRSASFLTAVRNGAAQAVLELLLGVNDVVGLDSEVRVYEAAGVPEGHHPSLSMHNLNDYWETTLGHAAHTGGVYAAPLVGATASSTERRTVVVVTDGLPPDLTELADALRATRSAGMRNRVHVLALARSNSDPAVRREPWRDELGPLARLRDEGLLTYSSISPGQEADWLRTRLSDQLSLDDVVAGLPFWEVAS
jgi:hypothetical protein